jgi:hypothetical protein
LRRSTTLCTWFKAFRKPDRSMVTRIVLTHPQVLAG